MASFAKAQLLKYGWTEGKGLGKNEDGIVDPLKPKLKFDTTGVGHESREYKWWESVYDRASSNVNIVSTSSSSISVMAKDEDAVDISTRKLDMRKLKKKHNLEYGSFLKTCTLDNGKVVPDENFTISSLDSVLHESPSFELTDEQLFRACGGRTAHKGARHGLTLSGKLSRIAAQEAEFLGPPRVVPVPPSDEWTEVKTKRTLKRKLSVLEPSLTDDNANTLVPAETPELRKKSKNVRRKDKRRVEALVDKLNSVVIVDDERDNEIQEIVTKATKRKAKKKIIDGSEVSTSLTVRRTSHTSKKRGQYGVVDDNEDDDCSARKKSRIASNCVVVLSDGSIINVDTEDIHRGDNAKTSKKNKEHTDKEYTDAERMNHRIEKKKKKRQSQTEKRRVAKLSDCLMAVNLCEDSVDSGRGEDLVESCETSRKLKKWKKHRKEKKDKKIEEIVILDP